MKYIIKNTIIFLLLLSTSICFSQSVGKKAAKYHWNPKMKAYEKVAKITQPSTMVFVEANFVTRKIVPSFNKVWVLPTQTTKGHWARPMVNELEKRRKTKATFINEVSITNYNRYPRYRMGMATLTAPNKPLNLNRSIPDLEWLNKRVFRNIELKGQEGKTTIFYAKTMHLKSLKFSKGGDYIIVVDTLLVPMANGSGPRMGNLNKVKSNYIKIVANHMIYESPIRLSSLNRQMTYVTLAAKKVSLKSVYNNLKNYELKAAAPMMASQRGVRPKILVFRDDFDKDEKMLLNRLFINSMSQAISELNGTNDVNWSKKYRLLEDFQIYRFNRVDISILHQDRAYERKYNLLCSKFDDEYEDYTIQKNVVLKDVQIVVEGMVSELPDKPLKYYPLPNTATLLATANEETSNLDKLGNIRYNPSGNANLKLFIECKLELSEDQKSQLSKKLKKTGISLSGNPSMNLVAIEEQPLKINGRSVGRIIPIGNQLIRLEVALPEESSSFAELFPKMGNNTFKVDFSLHSGKKTINQEIALIIPKLLLDRLDYTVPLESFNVIESNQIVDQVTIKSELSNMGEEGALDYVEVLLAFNFQSKETFRGPFRFSSSTTLASNLTIPFIKYSDKYSVTVRGLAFYEDGEKEIIPFQSKDKIIILDERIFRDK